VGRTAEGIMQAQPASDNRTPIDRPGARIDSHAHIGVDPLFYLQGWSPYCLDIPRLFTEAEGTGIDAFVVFPFVSYIGLDQEALRANRIELPAHSDVIPYRFENRRLQEEIRQQPPTMRSRLWAFLIADPGRRQQEQVAEWRALPADHAVHGIKIQGTIIQSKVIRLLDSGACILDYAEERDLPLLIHSSIKPADEWSQCADLLRVVEARPRVRFVLAHSCRFHQPSLRRVAELPNAWFDCSAHVIHCGCAVSGHPAVAVPAERFPSDYSSPERVLRDLAEAYPDKLVWGSDAPYYSIHYEHVRLRSSYRREVACLDALPAELRDRVARRNALAWLGRRPVSATGLEPAGGPGEAWRP
jgi:predicted TIM-barrel fold metal-dependent hydrolase